MKATTETKPMRCAVYLRVSVSDRSAVDEDGKTSADNFTSLDAQRRVCLDYIRKQAGWLFVKEYVEDGRSAKDLNRPRLQAMLDDVAAGQYDVVVCYRLDRFSRSVRDFMNLLEFLNTANCAFASATEVVGTATDQGKVFTTMLVTFAEFERKTIATRIRDKIALTRREGKWSGGNTPLGYSYKDKVLTIDETHAPTVRLVFDLYAKHQSINAVIEGLNERKIKARPRKGKARAWTKDAIVRMLKNPVYAGIVPHHGERIPGKHPAIVNPKLFERVGALLASKATNPSKVRGNPAFVMRGVLRCGCTLGDGTTCSATLSAGTTCGERIRENRYYRCMRRMKEGERACPAGAVSGTAIEAFIVDRLQAIAKAGDVAGRLRSLVEQAATMRPALQRDCEALPDRIAGLGAKGNDLTSKLTSANEQRRAFLEPQLERVTADLQRLQDQLTASTARLAAIDKLQADATWIAKQLDTFPKAWPTLEPEARNMLVRNMVRTIVVDQTAQRLDIVFAPLDDAMAAALTDNARARRELTIVVSSPLHKVRPKHAVRYVDAPVRPAGPVVHPARVARRLALAHHIAGAVDEGKAGTYTAVAKALQLSRSRITQLIDLTLLAPDIQMQVLHMTAVDAVEPAIFEQDLRRIVLHSLDWTKQRKAWTALAAKAGVDLQMLIQPVEPSRAA